MNKVTIAIVVSLITVIVILFLGRLVALSGIEQQIIQARTLISRLETDKKALDEKAKRLKATSVKIPKNSGKMLNPGEEAEAFKVILSCAAKKRFKFQNFEELKIYNVKSSGDNDSSQFSTQAFRPGQKLPKLDDQGMPVNLASQQDDTEWAGVEILPVKFAFKTTFSSIGRFLSNAKKNLPLHGVRNMDIIFDESGIVRGTIVLIFPESERK